MRETLAVILVAILVLCSTIACAEDEVYEDEIRFRGLEWGMPFTDAIDSVITDIGADEHSIFGPYETELYYTRPDGEEGHNENYRCYYTTIDGPIGFDVAGYKAYIKLESMPAGGGGIVSDEVEDTVLASASYIFYTEIDLVLSIKDIASEDDAAYVESIAENTETYGEAREQIRPILDSCLEEIGENPGCYIEYGQEDAAIEDLKRKLTLLYGDIDLEADESHAEHAPWWTWCGADGSSVTLNYLKPFSDDEGALIYLEYEMPDIEGRLMELDGIHVEGRGHDPENVDGL